VMMMIITVAATLARGLSYDAPEPPGHRRYQARASAADTVYRQAIHPRYHRYVALCIRLYERCDLTYP
jgi:hypothetical protein